MSSHTTKSPELRARISAATKAAMARADVRERISRRTKEGMAAASGAMDEGRLLRTAWRSARPSVRKRFLEDLFAPACGELSE